MATPSLGGGSRRNSSRRQEDLPRVRHRHRFRVHVLAMHQELQVQRVSPMLAECRPRRRPSPARSPPKRGAQREHRERRLCAGAHGVYFEGRGRLWAFNLQLDFGPQLAELRSCFQAPDAVLLRCDGEVEVISSLQQLQAPDLSALHLEEPQPLLARVLAEPNLRQLLAILCAPELASEAFRQDGVRILVEVICVSDDDVELASKGLCALLHTDRDLATSHLKALWPEMGLTLMRRLLQRPEGASLAVTLWLVEALEEAAEAFAAAGESPHMAAPGYRAAAKLARRKPPPEPTPSPTSPTSPEKEPWTKIPALRSTRAKAHETCWTF
ncbi:unnamed protein product [Effrenium voratum]|nr:unnamed protein product [Effrenium voratum]